VGDLLCRSFGAGRALARLFESMAETVKEGKKALAHFLTKQAALLQNIA
jgi:hypothetical protein